MCNMYRPPAHHMTGRRGIQECQHRETVTVCNDGWQPKDVYSRHYHPVHCHHDIQGTVRFIIMCRMWNAPLFPRPQLLLHTEHTTKHVLKCGTGVWKWILEVRLFPVKRCCERGNELLDA